MKPNPLKVNTCLLKILFILLLLMNLYAVIDV